MTQKTLMTGTSLFGAVVGTLLTAAVLAVNLATTPEPFTGWIPHAEVGGGEAGGGEAANPAGSTPAKASRVVPTAVAEREEQDRGEPASTREKT